MCMHCLWKSEECVLWKWSYRWLKAVMWVLRMELWSVTKQQVLLTSEPPL